MSPLYHIVPGLPSCPTSLTAQASGQFRSVGFADLIKGNQKAGLNALAVLGLFLVFDFMMRRRTLNLERIALRALPAGCASRATRARCEVWHHGPILDMGSYARLARCRHASSRLNSLL